jgi:hypothetical protein
MQQPMEPLIRPGTQQTQQSARGGLSFNKPANQATGELSKSINGLQNKSPGQSNSNNSSFQQRFSQQPTNQLNQSTSAGLTRGLLQKPQPQTSRPGTSMQPPPMQVASTPSKEVARPTYQPMLVDDEDEDLRLFANDGSIFGNPQLDAMFEDITRHVNLLKHADLSKRVDSLVSLNDAIGGMTEETQPVLVRAANELVGAFTHVMIDIFQKPTEEINLRFAKYFISIVLKTCSCREIMAVVSRERVFEFAEQLLTRLLIDGLDKAGENKEGEVVLKNLNSSMLRILENCNHTTIICVLIDLQRKYRDYTSMPKVPNLIVKCVLKISKIIEKLIDGLEVEEILLSMHEYMLVINHEARTANDETGIKMIKTVINEIIKLKGDAIWQAYRVIRFHGQPDLHILKWIEIILKSLRQGGAANATAL